MKTHKSVVVFLIDGYRYGMPLEMVERVAPVVEITPVPDAPDTVLGVINVRGKVIPVINMRKKLSMPERTLKLSDQLLICRVGDRSMALLVESIEGATDYSEDELAEADGMASEQALKTADGIVYIYDYERLLNSQEQIVLKKAMGKVSA